MHSLLPSVIRQASKTHTASLIFCHGLGDSGHGWAPVADQLAPTLPHVKFIFPNAPNQPVSLNMGMKMPSWYDIISLGELSNDQDQKGMLESVQKINKIIQSEIDSGIPANRIVLGGFSQGSVISLLTMLTSEYKLAGQICLSGYLGLGDKVFSMASDSSRKVPIFWGHGDSDQTVKYQYGVRSKDELIKNKYNVEFHTFPNMGHSACPEEIMLVEKFLQSVVPATQN